MATNNNQWYGPQPHSNHAHFEGGGSTTLRVGSFYGARSFLAHPDGAVSGVTYKKAWTPGVNTAECWRVTGWRIPRVGDTPYRPARQYEDHLTGRTTEHNGKITPEINRVFVGWSWKLESGETGLTKEEPSPIYGNNETDDHDLASCWCGFHSYWRGSLDFATDKNSVNGIVRSFGKVRRGPRGLRAQYAEIVALYIPMANPTERGTRPAEFESVARGLAFAAKAQSEELIEAVSARYPAVPIYLDLDDMLALHELVSP